MLRALDMRAIVFAMYLKLLTNCLERYWSAAENKNY